MLTYHATRAEAADRPPDWHTDAYFFEVRQQGRQPSQAFDMRIDAASLSVAERLRLEEGAPVVVRRMIRYVDGLPWSIQDSSYPDVHCQVGESHSRAVCEAASREGLAVVVHGQPSRAPANGPRLAREALAG
jgi:hypothetical protein